MKWIFAFLLAVLIFGGAALFSYKIFIRPELVMRAERKAGVPARPTPDVSLPEFEAAKRLKTEGKLTEARAALTALIQKYPSGPHVGEAQDLLGEVNVSILMSNYPSAGKGAIHRAQRRRPGPGGAKDEIDSGVDHAHE